MNKYVHLQDVNSLQEKLKYYESKIKSNNYDETEEDFFLNSIEVYNKELS